MPAHQLIWLGHSDQPDLPDTGTIPAGLMAGFLIIIVKTD
jgi:hypothetical protein